MSIPNYIRPQLTIKQLLDVTPDRTADRLNPVVVGPNYHVESITDASVGTGYDAVAFTVPYPNLPEGAIVDLDSVQLYAKGMRIGLQSDAGIIDTAATANIVTVDPTMLEYVRVGDEFVSAPQSDPSKTVTRKIVALLGALSSSSFDSTPNDSSSNPSTQASLAIVESPDNADFSLTSSGTFDGFAKGAVYDGKFGDLITIRVTVPGAAGTAKLSIRSASGLYDADNVATTSSSGNYVIDGSYFDGLAITIVRSASRNLVDSDVVQFQIKAPYAPVSGVTGLLVASSTSGYTGPNDTQYLIRVVSGGALGTAVVQVVDTAGIDVTQTYTVANNTNYNLGTYGLRFRFNSAAGTWNNKLRTGDVYVVQATAAAESTTTISRVVLDGPAIDTTGVSFPVDTTWEARTAFDGYIDPKATYTGNSALWVAQADGVHVNASFDVLLPRSINSDNAFTAVGDIGALIPVYRAIIPPAAGEGIIEIASQSDLTDNFGASSLGNVLGYGVARALAGAQGKIVYAVRTAGTSLADFTDAFKKISNTDTLYALAVLSDRLDVKQAAASHVDAMSAENVKNFRRAYVGTDSPVGGYSVLSKKSNGTNYNATVLGYLGTNTRLVCSDASFISAGIQAGDVVRINYSVNAFGDTTFTSYVVKQVLSETEIILKTGPVTSITNAIRFEVWKPDNAASKVSYVKAVSAAINSRRVANVWCDRGTSFVDGATTVIPNMFLAAEIAGLRCAVLPQQGLTNTEISTVTNAPSMYLSFSQAELNEVAAAGTFVVTQDVTSGSVYIRHQLTTRTDAGSLYYEDSVGVNLDNISFGVKDILTGYIGKRNASNDTVTEIKRQLSLYLNDQVLAAPTNAIGAALIAFTDPVVEIDATFKDTINISSQLTMPLPLNQIVVTLRGSTTL